jgi:hypothetical protein
MEKQNNLIAAGENSPYRSLIILLLSLLIMNPVVVYLLTRSILLSILCPLFLFIILQFSILFSRSKLVAVYLLNVFILISFFAHAELIFKTAFPDRVIDDLYEMKQGYYFNKPNLDKHFADREYSSDYMTNSQGYRIPYGKDAVHEVKQADWLFIGDSFTQGAQVNFEQLYTTLIYKRFPNKVIVNSGISGAGIIEEFNYYRKQGCLLSPSIVVLQICSFNDFMNVYSPHRDLSDYLSHISTFVRFLLQGLKYQNPNNLPLGRWTEPFQSKPDLNRDYNIFYRDESATKINDLEQFKNYLHLFNDEVKKRGSQLIVFLIPTKEQVDINAFQEVIDAFRIRPSDLDMVKPNNLMKQLTDELGIPFVDMLGPFRAAQKSVFFKYDEHLTIYGHEILASELSKILPNELGISIKLSSQEYLGERYPMYSKDGKNVTFQSPRNGKMQLFQSDAQFNNILRLASSDLNEFHPMLSGDGSQIAFTEGEQESYQTKVQIAYLSDIYKRETIPKEDNFFGAIPCFSYDSRYIAYAEWQRINKSQFSNPQIVILDLVNTKKTYITKSDHESWRPMFSPDNKRLIYISKYDRQFDLYLYNLEANREERITWTTFDEWDPSFSRDGHYIVYSANPDGNWDLFVYDLFLGETYRLTKNRGDEYDASFSPDGDQVIFAGHFGFIDGIYETTFSKDHSIK